MPRYKLIALTAPFEGRDQEYNDWYSNVHLQQVAALPGVKSAQRFRLTQAMGAHSTYPYLAIYDIETDDIGALVAEMTRRAGTESLVVSESADTGNAYAAIYEEFGPVVKSKA